MDPLTRSKLILIALLSLSLLSLILAVAFNLGLASALLAVVLPFGVVSLLLIRGLSKENQAALGPGFIRLIQWSYLTLFITGVLLMLLIGIVFSNPA